MADVRRLVGIDGRVLDDGLVVAARAPAAARRPGRAARAGRPADREKHSDSRSAPLRRARFPGCGPSAAGSSCAISRGALRSRRARSKATGVPRSPSARLGGYSIAMTALGIVHAIQPAEHVAHTRPDLIVQRKNHAVFVDSFEGVRYAVTLSDPLAFVMVDAGIGRLLISSLHQGIADVAPSRLEFYEEWLSPKGMRDGASVWRRLARC